MTRWQLTGIVVAGLLAIAFRPPGAEDGRGADTPSASYESEVARITGTIEAYGLRVEAQPSSWLERERLASAYLERARLTDDWDDYAAAEHWIDDAMRVAPEGCGPHLSRARLNYTLHRFDAVEPDLRASESRILLHDAVRAQIEGLRADVAFQVGQPGEARPGFETSLRLHRTPQALGRLALLEARDGDASRADGLLVEAGAAYFGSARQPAAWIELQRAILDLEAGRLDDALAHLDDAATILPGWWLVDEHVAEIAALQGRTIEAEALYRDILRRVDNPALMRALAGVLRSNEKDDEARTWDGRADREWERRAARFPEAANDHGHGHDRRHS